jgi:large subunit ribosomal protein L27
MSHVIAGGATSQTKNMVGKRLGVKKFAGQEVKNGNILVRQRGSVFHAGKNAKMARDFSIYAIADGFVSFRRMTGSKRQQYFMDVLPEREGVKDDAKLVAAPVEKSEAKTVAKVAKKPTEKKAPVVKTPVNKKALKKAAK